MPLLPLLINIFVEVKLNCLAFVGCQNVREDIAFGLGPQTIKIEPCPKVIERTQTDIMNDLHFEVGTIVSGLTRLNRKIASDSYDGG